MLASDAVEPALDPAGQPKVRRINRENERAIDDAAIEPVGQDKLHAFHASVPPRAFLPFVDPGELVAPPMLALTDAGADDGRLQTGQRPLQQLVVPRADLPADRDQKLVGREAQEARGLQTKVLSLDNLARRPNQHVSIPDG